MFRTAFSNNWAEKKMVNISLRNLIFYHIPLKLILRYLYCGQIDLSSNNGSDVFSLLIATDELGLQTLSEQRSRIFN
ncbi:unnamed protein product [Rhizophagus irregularis]|nr:unnamed protein product [Rhizophagus irregularis]